MKYGIIYKATNLMNGKCYVGKTVTSLNKRKLQHRSLHKNITNRRYDSVFYRAIRKDGWENFEWEIIDTCICPDMANDLEIYYINKFNSLTPAGYNLTRGGEGNLGWEMPDAVKKKISEANKGQLVTNEQRKKLSVALRGERNWMYGRTLPDKLRKNIGDRNRGVHPSEETRKKLSLSRMGNKNPNFGKHLTDEQKKKISLKMMGNKNAKK